MINEEDVYAALNEVFREVFRNQTLALQPMMTADDVKGWDSFKQVEIVLAVEERFGIPMGIREVTEFKSVGDLVRMLRAKG